jgi:Bacterial PH domain
VNTGPNHTQAGNEFETEPTRGLPELLPPGEQMLWQGSPDWRSLAVRAFHARKVAIYFAAMLLWRVVSGLTEGQSIANALGAAVWLLPLAIAATGILVLFAWLASRAAVYTITSRRVVMRIGVALPMTINIPFRLIESAQFTVFGDGTGDIPLRLVPPDRIAFLVLWPHCRPWRAGRPEPMIRSIPDAVAVAQLLSKALASAAGTSAISISDGASEPTRMPKPLSPAAA